jgi:serine/threonine protein kinase
MTSVRHLSRATLDGATARETGASVSRGPATDGGSRPTRHSERLSLPVLGRYRLDRRLGSGGFGTVWLAHDERLERDVAVKVLPRERIATGRFEREARAAARLSHPGIVTLYEAAVDDDGAYLVSELVRGSTLEHLAEAGSLSDRDIVAIGVALCDALEHAHGQGVVHRDVKPSNVLVPEQPSSPAGMAKLTDFGIARLIGGNTLTRTGEVVGTAAYMAPEQAEGRPADAAADLYSLSLMLYEALTGLNPIATSTVAGRTRRLGAHLPPLRRHRRDLPRELGRSIDLALRPRPRERGTIAELRLGLQASCGEVEDRPGVVEPPWTRSTPASAPSTPHEDPRDWDAEPAWLDRGGGGRLNRGPREPTSRPAWPERAPAAVATALTAAWLTATLFGSLPLGPAGAALIACLVVLALPRIGWLALVLATATLLSAQGRAGAALIVVLGALVPVVLLPFRPTKWPLPALAPALGVALLAGAWPALAGQEKTAWRRAALGATGWIWITFATLLTGHAVYARLPAGSPSGSAWMGSVNHTIDRVLSPLVASGFLAPAAIWALAAAILPWVMRGSGAMRLGLAAAWSAALATATAAALPPTAGALGSGVLVLGAVAAWVVVLAADLIKPPQSANPCPDPRPDLA